MTDGRMNGQTEEEMVTYEVSDEALETAAGAIKDKAGHLRWRSALAWTRARLNEQ